MLRSIIFTFAAVLICLKPFAQAQSEVYDLTKVNKDSERVILLKNEEATIRIPDSKRVKMDVREQSIEAYGKEYRLRFVSNKLTWISLDGEHLMQCLFGEFVVGEQKYHVKAKSKSSFEIVSKNTALLSYQIEKKRGKRTVTIETLDKSETNIELLKIIALNHINNLALRGHPVLRWLLVALSVSALSSLAG